MQRRHGVVPVQGREHEVPGQRGLHGDAGRLHVTDLTDEDHVGVLPQNRLQPVGERQARLLVGLDLVDLGEDELDRVLDRHDVAGPVADLAERGVQRRRLSASRRAGAQHHAEGRPHELGVALVGVGRACRGR